MALFLSSHRAKLDKKGRVSFPASFRTVLVKNGEDTFYLRPHHKHACVEGLRESALDALSAGLGTMDAYSDDAENLALTLYGEIAPVTCDAEGRFSMPQNLIEHAGLGESIVFVGLKDRFQVWEEQALIRRKAEAVAQVRDKGLTIPSVTRPAP